MTAEARIIRSLELHKKIMEQLQKEGMEFTLASREALRRLQDKKFKFDNWQDYFTEVEREGFNLPHS
jgi:hypothetical protein